MLFDQDSMWYEIVCIGNFLCSGNSIDLGEKILLTCQNISIVTHELEDYLKTSDHFEEPGLADL